MCDMYIYHVKLQTSSHVQENQHKFNQYSSSSPSSLSGTA